MVTTERILRHIVGALEPSSRQKAKASASYRHLRDQVIGRRVFGRRILDCYLSGSYRRHTAIYPLEDVDVIFVIDPSQWRGAYLGLSSYPDPVKVLRSFATVLRDAYQLSSTFTQRRSLRLELNHVHIDCVPAIAQPGTDFIEIGDHRKGGWIKSSPKAHHQALTFANQRNHRLVVPLVKLLKAWNRGLPDAARMRSFVIETIAVTLFSRVTCTSLEAGLFMFFDFMASFKKQSDVAWPDRFGIRMDWWEFMLVPDTAETGANTADGVTLTTRNLLIDSAIDSRDRLKLAMSAGTSAGAQGHVMTALNLP